MLNHWLCLNNVEKSQVATMQDHKYLIEISVPLQKLYLSENGKVLASYDVSTALNGAGEKINSECTPRGRHVISEKIGDECEVNTVFVGRKPTGECYTSGLRELYPERDWILTRILRLQGIEEGINKGGEVDTHVRMIYIHGSPEDVQMGLPGSHGCIRMTNQDVIQLYDKVPLGAEVIILG